MIKTNIVDSGSGRKAKVLEDNELLVNSTGCPPLLTQKCKIFSQFVTNDGLAGGTNDLGINGSGTAVEYWVPAIEDDDIYITNLSFVFGYGGSAQMFEFADSGAALTNGVLIEYTDSNGVPTTIMNPKANYSFMRSSLAPFTNTNWETRGFAAAGDYGYFCTVDLLKIIPPYGIKLENGTTQKLSVTIGDDCTGADLFNCNCFGFKRFE